MDVYLVLLRGYTVHRCLACEACGSSLSLYIPPNWHLAHMAAKESKMNALASSQCSSGCESGWTLYLEQSLQLNHNAFSHASSQFDAEDNDEYKDKKAKKEAAEEEDLSMVSDASSGPPHLPDAQDNGSFYSASKAAKLGKRSKKRQKVKEYQHLPSFLDDTASSSVFDFSMVSLILLAASCIALSPCLNNVTVTNQQTSTESMLEYSQGFSATYYEERSSLQDQFGFLEPSLSENGVENNKQMLLLERDGDDIKISSVSTNRYLCNSTWCGGRYRRSVKGTESMMM
ncbi:hypothetical protein V8G54_013803 [Vigna mungo]|uniref:Uncharacterized protein n=1 Tax=Vigna mungo TaxID=3915 RepID=A0AAQ3RY15_VIGMU